MKDLSIVIISNYIPSHPSIEHIQNVLESLCLLQVSRETKVIISLDKLKPQLADKKEHENKYLQYIQNLERYCKERSKFPNFELAFCERHSNILGNVKNGVSRADTKYILSLQHDLYFTIPLPIYPLIGLMESHKEVKHLRFNTLPNLPVYPGWDGWVHQPDATFREVIIDDIPLCLTPAWSDQNHLTTKEYYDTVVFPDCATYEGENNGRMEEVLNPLSLYDRKRYGTYIYGNYGLAPTVIHSDGREAPKHQPCELLSNDAIIEDVII